MTQFSNLDALPDWVTEKRRELATDNLNRAYEASLILLKWVLTSALVLHSTAIIAALGSTNYAKVLFGGPVWFFLVGAASTIGGGLLLAIGAADFAGKMSAALWRGEGVDSDVNEIFDPPASRIIISGASLLGLSVACFLLGTGFGVATINMHQPTAAVQSGSK